MKGTALGSFLRLASVPLVAAAALGLLPAGAIPPPPDSFDGETIRCQPSGSAVTVLICRDAELTALDAELRATFRRLRDDPSLSATQRESQVVDQRRWVEGMDQCWEAREEMRDCVKASQERRLRQLRAWAAANH
jgi:uncharacterized protein